MNGVYGCLFVCVCVTCCFVLFGYVASLLGILISGFESSVVICCVCLIVLFIVIEYEFALVFNVELLLWCFCCYFIC